MCRESEWTDQYNNWLEILTHNHWVNALHYVLSLLCPAQQPLLHSLPSDCLLRLWKVNDFCEWTHVIQSLHTSLQKYLGASKLGDLTITEAWIKSLNWLISVAYLKIKCFSHLYSETHWSSLNCQPGTFTTTRETLSVLVVIAIFTDIIKQLSHSSCIKPTPSHLDIYQQGGRREL